MSSDNNPAAAQEAVARSSIEDVIERARDATFGEEATPPSAVIDWIEAELANAAPVAAAPVEGGQITGWRNVDGMAVFTVASHSGITANQEFVRYDDHLAKLTSTPAAPGIDLDDVRVLLRYGCAGEACTDEEIQNQRNYDAAAERLYSILIDGKIDASPKGGSDSARLDALEKLVDDSGGALLLHHGCDNGRGSNGLGLRNTGRTLRQAIDQATSAEVGT